MSRQQVTPLSEIMALVDDLAGARDDLSKAIIRGCIVTKVCALTGDDARAEMEKRRAPCAPLKVPSHQRAVKAPKRLECNCGSPHPTAHSPGCDSLSLDQVVEQVARRLRLVPVGDEVGEGIAQGEEVGT